MFLDKNLKSLVKFTTTRNCCIVSPISTGIPTLRKVFQFS